MCPRVCAGAIGHVTSFRLRLTSHLSVAEKMDVMAYNGDKWTPIQIVIDSGAAENVMPRNMLRNVEMKPK